MATLKRIEFVDFGPYRMIGKEIRTKHEKFNPIFQSKYSTIPSLWKQSFSDGTFDTLVKMSEYCPPETPNGYEGYMRDFREEDGTFTYVAGFFMKANTPVPQGYACYEVPACTVAKSWIEGEEYDIYPNAYPLTVEAMKQNGYVVDREKFFLCEVYTDERFGIPKNNGQSILILDYYLPCIKKS